LLRTEQALDQRLPSRTKVRDDVAQDAHERADPEGGMTWDGDVMLSTLECSQAKMAPGLAGHPVTEIAEASIAPTRARGPPSAA
jgi:hypothetical protein